MDWLLWKSGETWTCERAADEALREPGTLYMRGVLSQQFYRYKVEMIERVKPGFLVIGSSRVWQFRRPMLPTHQDSFYNAGGMVQNLSDLEVYAEATVTGALHKPAYLVLGVDGWWLKREPSEQGKSRAWKRSRDVDEARDPRAHVMGVREMVRRGAVPWQLLAEERPRREDGLRPLGLAAFAGGGFRTDGSVTAHVAEEEFARSPQYRDRENPPVIQRIRTLTQQFAATDGLDPERVDRLVSALMRLRKAGVQVCVLMPPVSDECMAALRGSAPLARWWAEVVDALPARLKGEGFPCLSVTCPADFGLDDRYMIDGFHPSETFVVHILERGIREGQLAWPGCAEDLVALTRLRSRESVNPISLGIR